MSKVPSDAHVRQRIYEATGVPVATLQRFTTGNHHYVYDASLTNGKHLAARFSSPQERQVARDALTLNQFLRPELPLPPIFYHDLDAPFPFVLMERLQGKDLGAYFQDLPPTALKTIATHIGQFQQVTTEKMDAASTFGFAVRASKAPHKSWPEVLRVHLRRSEQRLQNTPAAAYGKRVEAWIDSLPELDRQRGIPFLHDLTTKNVIVTPEGELSGIVDVDDFCFGDPTFHLALTAVALDKYSRKDTYLDTLSTAYAGYRPERLPLYRALFFLDFLSEMGLAFNGNTVDDSPDRVAYLLQSLEQELQHAPA